MVLRLDWRTPSVVIGAAHEVTAPLTSQLAAFVRKAIVANGTPDHWLVGFEVGCNRRLADIRSGFVVGSRHRNLLSIETPDLFQ